MEQTIRLQKVSKYYTNSSSVVMGLSSVSLSFDCGELVAITGESGSGKSTLAHVISGILPYEAGEMYFEGKPTSHFDSADLERYRRDNISFISQSYGILEGNTVLENVESALRLYGKDPVTAEKLALDVIERVGLCGFEKRKAGRLSSGQKQRLSIARAIVKPSRVLVADEPTGNLDSKNSENVIALLKEAAKDKLVILITHEFEMASTVATRRIVMEDGAVVSDQVLRDPYNREKATGNSDAISECAQRSDDSISDVNYGKNTKKRKKPKAKPSGNFGLGAYITALTVKAHPIFTLALCAVLLLTSLSTFVFFGTFIANVDDTSTRIYDSVSFHNGDPNRIVVMRSDKAPLTEEDYEKLLDIKRVDSIQKRGYVLDARYYYREGTDFIKYELPNYGVNGLEKNGTYSVVEFQNSYEYIQTLPYSNRAVVKEGRETEDYYEIVSCDPSHNIGDIVTVYLKDIKNWSYTAYLKLDFTVVGKANGDDSRLYFDDSFAALLSGEFIFLPYRDGQFKIISSSTGDYSVDEGDFYFCNSILDHKIAPGKNFTFNGVQEDVTLFCDGNYNTYLPKAILVNEKIIEDLVDFGNSNQASVYIRDYSYTERVIDELSSLGYHSVSPFVVGSTDIDAELATQRIITLIVSFALTFITVVLMLILIKVLFNLQSKYHGLLSNMGLTFNISAISIMFEMALMTLICEFLTWGTILVLHEFNVSRIVDIFKYLGGREIVFVVSLHLISVVFATVNAVAGIKKRVFSCTKTKGDIVLLCEEVTES